MLSKRNQAIIQAKEKGYLYKDGNIIGAKGDALKLNIRGGYPHFCLNLTDSSGKKNRVNIPVHRYVAYDKFGDKIFDLNLVVRHRDGTRTNYHPDNLDIGTVYDNTMDRKPEDRRAHAIKTSTHVRRFSDAQVEEIRKDHAMGLSYKEIMFKWNISSKGTLSHLINNKYVTKVEEISQKAA